MRSGDRCDCRVLARHDLAVAKGVPAERLVATELSVAAALEEAVRLVRAKEIERQASAAKAIVDNIDEVVSSRSIVNAESISATTLPGACVPT